ncbi:MULTISPECIES: hypothetical protein [Chitinophagaceae]|uniref:hypothetical protein n=1 Tax=Chitinophagaceae TaxID=563835 RepID=UPI000DEF70B9|nr:MULTISPECIES: hypothetical protein [Chitinophagaceae]RPD47561.1 hypothetical protein DRJ53_12025 [Paracnuella aquatica]
MERADELVKIGMMAALSAMKQTLNLYPDGMSADDVSDMISEIDMQLGLKEAELQILKRA